MAAIACGALLLSGAGPAPDATVTPQRPRYTHAEMESALLAGEGFRCIYGTLDPAATEVLRARAEELARRFAAGDSSAAVADSTIGAAELARHSLLLVGGPSENRLSARLASSLPVRFGAAAFEWAGRRYDRPGDVLELVYPNPLAPQRFVVLIAANRRDGYARRGGVPFGDEDWRIERDGELARSGRFTDTPRPWSYDATLDHDRETERDRFAASLVGTPGAHGGVVVRASADLAPLRARIAEGCGASLARVAALGFLAAAREPIRVTLYHSLEEKGVLTHDTRPEHLDARGEPQLAPAAGHVPDLWSIAAAYLVRGGASRQSRFLEPAGAWCAGRWGGERLEPAVSRLYFGRLWPRARDAVSRPVSWRSPLVMIPARALLFAACTDVAGARAAAVTAVLVRADPPGDLDSLCRAARLDPAAVERRYATLGDSLARVGQAAARAGAPRPWRPADGFQRGVCLEHAANLEQGYLSRACLGQLDVLRAMGAGAVSLAPFGTVPADGSGEIVPAAAGGPEGESDEAIGEAIARAHARGMRVWLAPRLWARDGVGDLAFTPAGWTRFFARYREFLLHYALLGEREQADGVLVGSELASATATHPERWRELIAATRRVYDGTLCYGASWDEAGRIDFWDALDLIGVSACGPLASAPGADAKTLRAGAARTLGQLHAVASRWRRPVLLSAAGYPAVAAAAVRPWDESGAADPEAQRACYEALVGALERETWVAGVFWYKWSSADHGGGPAERGFTPRGKPAEAVMRAALEGWKDRPVIVPAPSR